MGCHSLPGQEGLLYKERIGRRKGVYRLIELGRLALLYVNSIPDGEVRKTVRRRGKRANKETTPMFAPPSTPVSVLVLVVLRASCLRLGFCGVLAAFF